MATPQAAAMKAVVQSVHPVLRVAGYRKRANSFNREAEPGVIHVIGFQMGAFRRPPGPAEIPGTRPNLYGRFTVNLGVYLRRAAAYDAVTQPPDFVPEFHCHLRRRLGRLMDPPADRWWPLDQPGQTGPLMQDLIMSVALSWLAANASWTTILDKLEARPAASRAVTGAVPDRLLATRMRLADGEHAAAQRNFSAYTATVLPATAHGRFLSEFAGEHNLRAFSADA